MNQTKKTQKKTQTHKTKYKLNIYKGGVVYANSIFEMVYKIITKKIINNENSDMGQRRKLRKPKNLNTPVQQLNS